MKQLFSVVHDFVRVSKWNGPVATELQSNMGVPIVQTKHRITYKREDRLSPALAQDRKRISGLFERREGRARGGGGGVGLG